MKIWYIFIFSTNWRCMWKKESSNEKDVVEGASEGSLEFVMMRRDGVEVYFLFLYTCDICWIF